MKRFLFVMAFTLASLSTLTSGASAQAQHKGIGLGFRAGFLSPTEFPELHTTAPIGLRWWLESRKVGIDAALGYRSREDAGTGETLTDWALEAGVPFIVRSWDRVHVIFRPGFNYTSRAVILTGPVRTENDTYMTVSAEIEAELFLMDNLSLSAGHGIGLVSYNPAAPGDGSTTSFATFGNNATTLGFHIYLW